MSNKLSNKLADLSAKSSNGLSGVSGAPSPTHSLRYSRETVTKLAEGGMRPAAIARHLDANYDHVARDIRAARASGRSIPAHGSGPVPRAGRPCPGDEVVRLSREGLRASEIAVRLGHSSTNVAYHLHVARRAGELPPTIKSKPGPAKRTPARWTGVDSFPPAAEVADQVAALGLDCGLPVHEVFRMLWLGLRRTQIAGAVWVPMRNLARLSERLHHCGILLARSAPGRYDIVPLQGRAST